jgi:lipopolysaccharide/colanic/teichoic acid biosynthesis glycosyltransferase
MEAYKAKNFSSSMDPIKHKGLKRLMDLTFSIAGIILFSPLILVLALIIKLTSKGPVFFSQERVGLKGQRFRIYKLRTMHNNAHPYQISPRDRKDERITWYGRFLRRTGLDELPQLINVIKGEMSIVGPRPEMPFITEQYDETARKRLLVKPGITGLWQIYGDRKKPIHEDIHYDIKYLENHSLWLDILIILKTIIPIVKGNGY